MILRICEVFVIWMMFFFVCDSLYYSSVVVCVQMDL